MYKSLHLRFAADALTLTIKVLLHCPTTFTVISVFNMQRRVLWNCWCYETSYSVEKIYIHSLIHSWSGRIVSIYLNVNPLNDILRIFTNCVSLFLHLNCFHHYSPCIKLLLVWMNCSNILECWFYNITNIYLFWQKYAF